MIWSRGKPSKFIAAIVIVLLFSLAILEFINYDKIALGLKLADLKLGGQRIGQAEASLSSYLASLNEKEIVLTYANKSHPAKPADLGLGFNVNQNFKKIVSIGRQKNVFAGLTQQIMALIGSYNLDIDLTIDNYKLSSFISANLLEIEKPAQDATLAYNKQTQNFDLKQAQGGQLIDRDRLKKDLAKINKTTTIPLAVLEDQPEVTNEETGKAKETAQSILNASPLTIEHNAKQWLADKDTVATWLEFGNSESELAVSIDQDKIEKYLNKISAAVNREPINAQLIMKDGKVSVFSLAQKGYKLNTQENIEKIIQALGSGTPQKITLGSQESEPLIITNEDIKNLGLTTLLGTGLSDFAGSPKNRIHNIKVGLAKMNGILLKPGEEFSFNNLIGEIDAESGYLAELVIKKNKTVAEYGGGLCQVSTNIFRAAINSGLKITERYAHAFPVKYYDPQGFDATIYPPSPDLRFINDTPNHLLIQSRIEGTKLIFEFYGTKDDRQVKVIGPTVYEKKADGSLKAILYQEIWRDGQLERKDTFRSNYKSPDLYPIERNPLE